MNLSPMVVFSPRLALCILSLALVAPQAHAEIQIETVDGRTLVGELDQRSDPEIFWIRHEEKNLVLTTAVAREEIAEASLDGDSIEIDTVLDQLKSAAPSDFWSRQKEVVTAAVVERVPQGQPRSLSRIVAIQSQARLANRDRDVEPDGVELAVAAVDEHGEYAAVDGNLRVRLWGERVHSHGSSIRFETLQRWTQPVAREDFVDGVAVYYLRFRTVQPELDLSLSPDALLNTYLGVHQQGSYESTTPVCLRPVNPFRDRLQYWEGSRFFRRELSEEVRQGVPSDYLR